MLVSGRLSASRLRNSFDDWNMKVFVVTLLHGVVVFLVPPMLREEISQEEFEQDGGLLLEVSLVFPFGLWDNFFFSYSESSNRILVPHCRTFILVWWLGSRSLPKCSGFCISPSSQNFNPPFFDITSVEILRKVCHADNNILINIH